MQILEVGANPTLYETAFLNNETKSVEQNGTSTASEGNKMDFGDIVVNPYKQNEYYEQPRPHFKGLMARGVWQPEMAVFMQEHQIEALYLNCARGWEGDDLGFVEELPFLKQLDVVTDRVVGVEAISSLPHLERLKLDALFEGRIDFQKLSRLTRCFLARFRGAESIYEAPALEELYLNEPPKGFHERISHATLKSLTLGNTPFSSLEFISSQRDTLTKLELLNCRKVSSLAPISTLHKLRWLRIDGSPLPPDINFATSLANLEVFILTGKGSIKSIAPLTDLKHLGACALNGLTIVDGNLEPLTRMPRLSMLSFQAKKHYSHRLVKRWSWEDYGHPDVLLAAK